MRANAAATSSENEREELRALIEQKTKEFEKRNGEVKTLDIVKKSEDGGVWNGAQVKRKSPDKSAAQIAIDQAISERYAKAECVESLAKELGISVSAMVKRASRLGVYRDTVHPNTIRANERMEKVSQLLEQGETMGNVAKKLQWPERTVRYYRNRLASINKAADAIEKTIDGIEARKK